MEKCAVLVFCAVATGCAQLAPSPQQASRPPNPTHECFDTRVRDPEFSMLRSKIVLALESPTLDMQADKSTPSQADRTAIRAYAKVREECFAAGEEWMRRYAAPWARSLYDYGNKVVDANLAGLYRSDLTFGQYNVLLEALRRDGKRKWDEAREIERREADAARRQAAIEAILTMPPAPVYRPPQRSNTSCQVFGNQMYCNTTSP